MIDNQMSKDKQAFHLISYASGLGGIDNLNNDTGKAPFVIQQSIFLNELKVKLLKWLPMIEASAWAQEHLSKEDLIVELTKQIALQVSQCVQQKQPFCVLGGDHTVAIGTWSGIYDALHTKGDIGLIWIDAHMDSHTKQTSQTGRIHGMPLACLLGFGDAKLTSILHQGPKIKPDNLCLIGVRSYEAGEAALLNQLNIRVYYMDEVRQRSFKTVFKEAVQQIKKNTIGFGLSVDIDSIDPKEAPGVGVPEKKWHPYSRFTGRLVRINI